MRLFGVTRASPEQVLEHVNGVSIQSRPNEQHIVDPQEEGETRGEELGPAISEGLLKAHRLSELLTIVARIQDHHDKEHGKRQRCEYGCKEAEKQSRLRSPPALPVPDDSGRIICQPRDATLADLVPLRPSQDDGLRSEPTPLDHLYFRLDRVASLGRVQDDHSGVSDQFRGGGLPFLIRSAQIDRHAAKRPPNLQPCEADLEGIPVLNTTGRGGQEGDGLPSGASIEHSTHDASVRERGKAAKERNKRASDHAPRCQVSSEKGHERTEPPGDRC